MKKVKDKIAREDLLDEADRIKILHTCDENARDRAVIVCHMEAGTFLRDNGYELDISPVEENTELREMLSEIKKHQRDLEPTIMKQLFLYVSERINKYESKT